MTSDTQPSGGATGAEIKDGTIAAADLIPNAGVTGAVVADGSLSGADFAGGLGVVRTGRITISDPTGGGATSKSLVSTGPFKVLASCDDTGAAAT